MEMGTKLCKIKLVNYYAKHFIPSNIVGPIVLDVIWILGVVCFVVKGRKSQVHLRLTVIRSLFHRVSRKLHLHPNYDSLATQTVTFVVMQISLTAHLQHKQLILWSYKSNLQLTCNTNS